MEQLVPAPLGSGGLPCATRGAGRQARLEGPFTRVLPGGGEKRGTDSTPSKAASFHAPELLCYLRHITGNSTIKNIS